MGTKNEGKRKWHMVQRKERGKVGTESLRLMEKRRGLGRKARIGLGRKERWGLGRKEARSFLPCAFFPSFPLLQLFPSLCPLYQLPFFMSFFLSFPSKRINLHSRQAE